MLSVSNTVCFTERETMKTLFLGAHVHTVWQVSDPGRVSRGYAGRVALDHITNSKNSKKNTHSDRQPNIRHRGWSFNRKQVSG